MNFVEVVRTQATATPQVVAYAFLADGDVEAARLTYAELDRQARGIATALQEAGAAGERVLLLFPSGLEFIAAFFGCLYAGAVAVPAYPPRLARGLPRLRAILDDARPRVILTTAEISGRARGLLGGVVDLAPVAWLTTEGLDARAGDWREREVRPAPLEQRRVEEEPGGRALVGCGRAWMDQRVEVVDPETGGLSKPEGWGRSGSRVRAWRGGGGAASSDRAEVRAGSVASEHRRGGSDGTPLGRPADREPGEAGGGRRLVDERRRRESPNPEGDACRLCSGSDKPNARGIQGVSGRRELAPQLHCERARPAEREAAPIWHPARREEVSPESRPGVLRRS